MKSPFLMIARSALQWRLMLLWIVTLLIPTALLTLPVWQILAAQLNYSVHANALAHNLSMNAISDLISAMTVNSLMLQQAGIATCAVVILLSPFLNGAVVTAARAPTPLTLGKLIHGGVTEYWRMFRLLVWAIIPLGTACAIGMLALRLARNYGETVILQSHAELASYSAILLLALLFLIAHLSVDAGRAQYVLSTARRSAVKAWWRGVKLMIKRPWESMGFYLVITLVGITLSAVLGLVRMHVNSISTVGFIVGLIFTQFMVACNAWMRIARLFALTSVSKK